MNDKVLSNTSIVTGIGFLSSCAAFLFLVYNGASPSGLMVPAATGWLIALIGLRSKVAREKRTVLYLVFGVLALLIFFIHKTYENSISP